MSDDPTAANDKNRPSQGLSFAEEFATPMAVVAVWMGLLGGLIAVVSYLVRAPIWLIVASGMLCFSGALLMGISSWKASRKKGVSTFRVMWNSFLSAFNFFMLFP